MAYQTDDPRYGFSFRTTYNGTSKSKTVNNVNIAMGGSSAGYNADQIGNFIGVIAQSIMGATSYDNLYINAQYPLYNTP